MTGSRYADRARAGRPALPVPALVLALALSTGNHGAWAQTRASEASTLSMLPVAVSVAIPAGVLVAGAALTVVSVEAGSRGAVWLLERASDGTRLSLQVSGQVAGGLSVAAGTAVTVSAISAGWLLSAAGQVIAFVPNEIGRALLHHERLTP